MRPPGAILLLYLATVAPFIFPAGSNAQCPSPAERTGRLLNYTFEPTITQDGTVLHVTVQFHGDTSGMAEIQVPNHWAGESLHSMINLRALSEDTVITDGTDPDTRTVRFPPTRTVRLTYDLIKDWTGPLIAPLQFHPVLMPQYLKINGENALVFPTLGIFTAGEFRVRRFKINNRPAVLAIRDQWRFTDDEAVTAIQNTIGTVRNFWHYNHFPYFLVTLKAYENEKDNGDGSAFTNAFWLYMSHQDTIAGYLPIVAHEAFHNWNPGRMGDVPEQDENRIKWFREGFTTYYGDLLVHRAGWMTFDTYLERINRDLYLYSHSESEYVRGRVIALWLDGQIRRDSAGRKSLDNVMFDMVRTADRPLTERRIIDGIDRYLLPANRTKLQNAVELGTLPELGADALGPCASIAIEDLPTFDLGFDFPASRKAHTIVAVTPDGPAFRAGLRDGQKITHWSVYNDQPEKPARVTIEEGGGRRVIEYFPRGTSFQVPQFHRTACHGPLP